VIAQTIERLPDSHVAILEVASVAGPTFSAAAIAAPLGLSPSTVERRCAELAELGVMIEACGEASWPDMTVSSQYGFLHALYREVLYQRLTAARRAELHTMIGRRLEQAFSSDRRAAANELAAHFLAGHDADAAVRYSLMAADVQLQRGAHREATELLIAARQLLVIQPGSIDRDRHELQLLIAMGNASLLAHGYSADASIALYEEARVLSEQIGEGRHLLPVYYGLWKNANGRGHFELTSNLSVHFLELAQAYGNDVELLVALRARAWSLIHEGDLATARTHLDQVVTFGGDLAEDDWVAFGEHPIIVGMSSVAWLCWTAAEADAAREWSTRAVAAGRRLGHPLTQCYTLFIDGLIRQWYGEVEAAMASATEALEVAEVHEFQLWRAWATSILGWAMARSGDIDQGLARIEAGLTAAENIQVDMWRGFFTNLYADALRSAGRDAEALSEIGQALLVADRTNERFFQSDLLCHRGSILATMGKRLQAQEALHAAIEIADRHGWLAFRERAGVELNQLLSEGVH
jgi:tetratricopeptide (TPR) repeat protein